MIEGCTVHAAAGSNGNTRCVTCSVIETCSNLYVSVEFVVRKITRKRLHSGIKSMLSEHRTELLHDDRKL